MDQSKINESLDGRLEALEWYCQELRRQIESANLQLARGNSEIDMLVTKLKEILTEFRRS